MNYETVIQKIIAFARKKQLNLLLGGSTVWQDAIGLGNYLPSTDTDLYLPVNEQIHDVGIELLAHLELKSIVTRTGPTYFQFKIDFPDSPSKAIDVTIGYPTMLLNFQMNQFFETRQNFCTPNQARDFELFKNDGLIIGHELPALWAKINQSPDHSRERQIAVRSVASCIKALFRVYEAAAIAHKALRIDELTAGYLLDIIVAHYRLIETELKTYKGKFKDVNDVIKYVEQRCEESIKVTEKIAQLQTRLAYVTQRWQLSHATISARIAESMKQLSEKDEALKRSERARIEEKQVWQTRLADMRKNHEEDIESAKKNHGHHLSAQIASLKKQLLDVTNRSQEAERLRKQAEEREKAVSSSTKNQLKSLTDKLQDLEARFRETQEALKSKDIQVSTRSDTIASLKAQLDDARRELTQQMEKNVSLSEKLLQQDKDLSAYASEKYQEQIRLTLVRSVYQLMPKRTEGDSQQDNNPLHEQYLRAASHAFDEIDCQEQADALLNYAQIIFAFNSDKDVPTQHRQLFLMIDTIYDKNLRFAEPCTKRIEAIKLILEKIIFVAHIMGKNSTIPLVNTLFESLADQKSDLYIELMTELERADSIRTLLYTHRAEVFPAILKGGDWQEISAVMFKIVAHTIQLGRASVDTYDRQAFEKILLAFCSERCEGYYSKYREFWMRAKRTYPDYIAKKFFENRFKKDKPNHQRSLRVDTIDSHAKAFFAEMNHLPISLFKKIEIYISTIRESATHHTKESLALLLHPIILGGDSKCSREPKESNPTLQTRMLNMLKAFREKNYYGFSPSDLNDDGKVIEAILDGVSALATILGSNETLLPPETKGPLGEMFRGFIHVFDKLNGRKVSQLPPDECVPKQDARKTLRDEQLFCAQFIFWRLKGISFFKSGVLADRYVRQMRPSKMHEASRHFAEAGAMLMPDNKVPDQHALSAFNAVAHFLYGDGTEGDEWVLGASEALEMIFLTNKSPNLIEPLSRFLTHEAIFPCLKSRNPKIDKESIEAVFKQVEQKVAVKPTMQKLPSSTSVSATKMRK